ncbi:MAG TPA: hypothetical protein VN651_11545 [Gemmatimonadaceae bacterium]|nr:hypothetical protein [Gemmatimonadaceae bacterium]
MGKVNKAGTVRKGGIKKNRGKAKASRPEPSRFRVHEVDPRRVCGARTSVERLFRVDETNDTGARAHLVFFDRHGWYCEHSADCPAVPHARKFGARSSRAR